METRENLNSIVTQIIGKTIPEAKNIYSNIRVVAENGVSEIITMEMQYYRINVTVLDGKISSFAGKRIETKRFFLNLPV